VGVTTGAAALPDDGSSLALLHAPTKMSIAKGASRAPALKTLTTSRDPPRNLHLKNFPHGYLKH